MANRPKKDKASPQPDRGDATPPHGDELQSEHSFGRTDRYANSDDPEAERPVFSDDVLGAEEDSAAGRKRTLDTIDESAERDARTAVRRRERSAG